MNKNEAFNNFKDLEGQSFSIFVGAREIGKCGAITEALWNYVMYKKYRTRIPHITHTRRKLWQRKK